MGLKKALCVFLCTILICATVSAVMFIKNYSDSCKIYAQNGIKSHVTMMMHQTASKHLTGCGIKYSDICTLTKKEDGSVGSICIDGIRLSLLSCDIADLIYKNLQTPDTEFGVPLGAAFGSKAYSAKGPKIPVTVVPIGAVATENTSIFLSGGVNQTLHRIGIRFSVTVDCLSPFVDCSSVATVEIIIAETVISGEVPGVVWTR